jgi:YesN/AraC family two-component response regulator
MNETTMLSRYRVLVIDDEQFSRSIIMRMVRDLGCLEPVQASNGAEGLGQLRTPGKMPWLVVSDFNMPVLNGLQLLKAIRIGKAGIPHSSLVVMLTGHTDFGLVAAAMALDVDAFVVKPVSKANLMARLTKALADEGGMKTVEQYQKVDIEEVCSRMLSHEPVGKPRQVEAPKKTNGIATKLENLKEGSVLAEDIRSPDGELLLGTGMPLSLRFIKRLCELKTVMKLEFVHIQPPAKT